MWDVATLTSMKLQRRMEGKKKKKNPKKGTF
jgi:hypothetical protein